MGWTIEIDEGAEKTTIEAYAKFALGFKATPTDNNEIESVLYTLSVEGKIVAATPQLVATGFINLANNVVAKSAPVRINILLDGVSQWDLKPENGFTGPFVTSFVPVDSPGNGYGHWKYSLDAVFRSKNVGGGNQQEQIYEFVSTLSVIKDHDIVVRKVWKVSAKGTSASAVRNFLRRFKPSGDDIKEEQGEDFGGAGAGFVWIWQALQKTHCEIMIEGGGRDYLEDRQAGVDKPPVLFVEQQSVKIIRVRGTVRGFTPALTPPPKHFAESATLREVTAAPRYRPTIERAEDGVYVLHFEEVWKCTDPSDPTPVHQHEHDLITLDASSIPGDGGIRS